jgi:hypothetical protein
MTRIAHLGSVDAFASPAAAMPLPTAGPAQARQWFDSAAAAPLGAGSVAGLRAEVEPGARGLSVAQHAERVLANLVAQA